MFGIGQAMYEIQLKQENARLKADNARYKSEIEYYKQLLEHEKLKNEPCEVRKARETIFNYENNICLVCGERHGNGLLCPNMRVMS